MGLGAYFSKLIFALKPWDWAGRFEYHEPYNRNDVYIGGILSLILAPEMLYVQSLMFVFLSDSTEHPVVSPFPCGNTGPPLKIIIMYVELILMMKELTDCWDVGIRETF